MKTNNKSHLTYVKAVVEVSEPEHVVKRVDQVAVVAAHVAN